MKTFKNKLLVCIIFDFLDAKIKLNNKINVELEGMANCFTIIGLCSLISQMRRNYLCPDLGG